MTGKARKSEPAAPGTRHLMAEALGLADKPKDADDATVEAFDYGGTDEVLDDATFDALDTDGDRVVHLQAEIMKGTYPPETPEGKARKSAPENKDASRLRSDKDDDPEATTLPAPERKPIGTNLRPGQRGRNR